MLALFTIFKTWKLAKCPSEWIRRNITQPLKNEVTLVSATSATRTIILSKV